MIGEVLYLIIATVALMLRRLEHWVSERFSGTTVTQIKPGELEARDAKYFKMLESRRESKRHEAAGRSRLSKHKSHGASNTNVKIRKSQTMAEILNKRKKKIESFRSVARTKGTMKQIESASSDIAKQELPNPAIIEQDTSGTKHKKTSEKFVKFKNRKVQLTPPPTKTADATTNTKVTGKLPPLKEQLRNKNTLENVNDGHNFKPKHKRKLSDMLRNLPRKMTSHKSLEGCNVEKQTNDKKTAVKKHNSDMQKNAERSESQKKKNTNVVFSKKNSLKENSLGKASFVVVKPLNPILKRSSVPRDTQVSSLDDSYSQAADSASPGLSTSSTISPGRNSKKLLNISEDDANVERALQQSKDKNAEDFSNPDVILKYRLASHVGSKKKQEDSILNQTTYENYKRDLAASPKFEPLTRLESADSNDAESPALDSPRDGTVGKLIPNHLYDDAEIVLIDSIEKEFL